MARPQKPDGYQQRIARFARRDLVELVDELGEEFGSRPDPSDLVGALIIAARRLPLEIVRDLMPAYARRQKEELSASESGD